MELVLVLVVVLLHGRSAGGEGGFLAEAGLAAIALVSGLFTAAIVLLLSMLGIAVAYIWISQREETA